MLVPEIKFSQILGSILFFGWKAFSTLQFLRENMSHNEPHLHVHGVDFNVLWGWGQTSDIVSFRWCSRASNGILDSLLCWLLEIWIGKHWKYIAVQAMSLESTWLIFQIGYFVEMFLISAQNPARHAEYFQHFLVLLLLHLVVQMLFVQ